MPHSRPSVFAKAYARIAPKMDARGAAQHRVELVADLHGAVVEVGCGPGGMFGHYPPSVRSVLAVEPDDFLREHAERAAAAAPVAVTVIPGSADNLPAGSGFADAVVFSLVLCSVPSQAAALAEARRVLKPGGALRFYEHVRSNIRAIGLLEDLVTPAWRRAAGGCHLGRDTAAAIADAGFRIESVRRFPFAPASFGPGLAHVLGRAVAP